ncbi:MAG TPA: peptidoglycan-binding domain-containing protein [Pseudacidobacterium sp.]|jgi:hypothetical protein|nr:peptidoglycan-binding domain-containing protein [Pseudacidobacterium sp.]
MLSVRACQTILLTAVLVTTPAFAGRSHRAATSGHSKKKSTTHKVQGQRGIDDDRARQIQTALIKEKYLSGEPSGEWDNETQAAMEKYQADHGWQTKLVPDSRALIKLGLGPDHSGSLTTAGKQTEGPAPSPASSGPNMAAANTLASAHSLQD